MTRRAVASVLQVVLVSSVHSALGYLSAPVRSLMPLSSVWAPNRSAAGGKHHLLAAPNLREHGALTNGGKRRHIMDIARNFGFLFSEVSRRYVQRFERKAQKMSLTLPTCKVLAYLDRNAGISQARLAELTDIEPMTVVRILDRMEAEGLVERRHDPVDRRAHCLCLTLQAKPALDEIWRLADQTRTEIFAGVSQAERTAFLHVLERLAHNLRVLEEPSIEGDSGVAHRSAGRKALASTRRTRILVDRSR